MEDVKRLEARVQALEEVLLEICREKDFEESSDYQMGRSKWEERMERIQAARNAE